MAPRQAFVVIALLAWHVGCSSVSETAENKPPSIDECVSEEGQRFLTFCASKDAAQLATRQHGIEVGAKEEGPEDVVALPVDGAPVRGVRDAPLTIHLFSDLRCEECRAVYSRLAAEIDAHPYEMRLVFRHAPRDEAGRQMARASIAAAEQGKFWEFVDELHADDYDASRNNLIEIARSAGLDVEQWNEDRRSPVVDAVLERDSIYAEEIGLVDAPTFFINGLRNVGGVALGDFDDMVQREREHIKAMEDAGLSGADISWRRILQNYDPVDWQEVEKKQRQMEAELAVRYIPVGPSPQIGATTEESLATMVVFADFECPYSMEAARSWMELIDRYEPQGFRVVYKHFPLSIHDEAERMASASALAADEGVFWEFFDTYLGEDVDEPTPNPEATLRNLGWTGPDFQSAIDDEWIADRISADRELGRQMGVSGTPTVFVNGIELVGVFSTDELAPLIEDQLALGRSIREMTDSHGEDLYRQIVEANRGL